MTASNLIILLLLGLMVLLLVFVVVWTVLMFIGAVYRHRVFKREGVITRGVIRRRWIQRVGAGRTRGVQYWLDYSYEASMSDGSTRALTGNENVWVFRYNHLEEGTPVQVEYAANNPELSRLRS